MLLGFLVTLTSVGAGALGVVMLVYLYPLRMIPARLVGTDIVHAIPLTILARHRASADGHRQPSAVARQPTGSALGARRRSPALLGAMVPGDAAACGAIAVSLQPRRSCKLVL